jgi:acetylornithine deacetylase/succinyl-diaminopimelate desuccinylase-like protein
VDEAARAMIKAKLNPAIIVDCSHGNSEKKIERQGLVLRDVLAQRSEPGSPLVGLMLEGRAGADPEPGGPPPELLEQWQRTGFDETDYLTSVGYTVPHGERGYSTLEQQWARPTLEINGLWGGYQGAGSKTVIPAEAHCKFTCRLVGDMDPDDLRRKIRAHVEARLPVDARVTWDSNLEGSRAAVMNTDRPEFAAARAALSAEWNREAVIVGMGGSIPIAGYFKEILGMDAMLIGFANDDDAIHSPNEKYDVASFHKGIRSWARILAALNG